MKKILLITVLVFNLLSYSDLSSQVQKLRYNLYKYQRLNENEKLGEIIDSLDELKFDPIRLHDYYTSYYKKTGDFKKGFYYLRKAIKHGLIVSDKKYYEYQYYVGDSIIDSKIESLLINELDTLVKFYHKNIIDSASEHVLTVLNDLDQLRTYFYGVKHHNFMHKIDSFNADIVFKFLETKDDFTVNSVTYTTIQSIDLIAGHAFMSGVDSSTDPHTMFNWDIYRNLLKYHRQGKIDITSILPFIDFMSDLNYKGQLFKTMVESDKINKKFKLKSPLLNKELTIKLRKEIGIFPLDDFKAVDSAFTYF